jgi:hypothetical protein
MLCGEIIVQAIFEGGGESGGEDPAEHYIIVLCYLPPPLKPPLAIKIEISTSR